MRPCGRYAADGERARDPAGDLGAWPEHGAGGLPHARRRSRRRVLDRAQVHADHDRQGHARPRRIGPAAGLPHRPSAQPHAAGYPARSGDARVRRLVGQPHHAAAVGSQGDARRAPSDPRDSRRARRQEACEKARESMTLTTIGWAVVHSLWQGALVAGLTALLLALVPGRRARLRYGLASLALAVIVVGSGLAALTAVDLLGYATRRQIYPVIDDAIGMPVVVQWRAAIVQSAAILWISGISIGLLRLALEWRRART